MSEHEKKNNRGAVFHNRNKDKPSQPDMVGTAIIDGKEKRMAVWVNKSASDGSEYFTFIFSDLPTEAERNSFRKGDQPAEAPAKVVAPAPATKTNSANNDVEDLREILDMDDDSPF